MPLGYENPYLPPQPELDTPTSVVRPPSPYGPTGPFIPTAPSPTRPKPRPRGPRPPSYVRPVGTIRVGGDYVGQAVDAYRSSAGQNPRGTGRLEGESRGDFNRRIAKWDAGFNRAAGRHFEGGDWVNSDDTHMFVRGQGWINPQTGEATTSPGGGGGGGGENDSSTDLSGPAPALEGAEGMIARLMSGELSPYGTDAINAMKSSAFEDAAGGVTAANRSAVQRARRSGGLYSASAGSDVAENERAGRSDVSRASRDIDTKATEANFAARIEGLNSQLNLMQQERDERMANAKNEVERMAIERQYAGLIDSTRMKVEAEERAATIAADSERASGRASRDFQREMSALEWERALNQRAYEEPFRLYQASSGLGEE